MKTVLRKVFKTATVFIVLSQLILVYYPAARVVAAATPAPVIDSYAISPDSGTATSTTPTVWVHAKDPSGFEITKCESRYKTLPTNVWSVWTAGIYAPDQMGPDANGVTTNLVGAGSCASLDLAAPLAPSVTSYTGQVRVMNSHSVYGTSIQMTRTINRTVPVVSVQSVVTDNNPLPTIVGTVNDPKADLFLAIHNTDSSIYYSYVPTNNGNGTWSAPVTDVLPNGLYTIDVTADNLVNQGYATGTYLSNAAVTGVTTITVQGAPATVANDPTTPASFSYTLDNSFGNSYSGLGYFFQLQGVKLDEIKTFNYVDGSNVVDLKPYFREWSSPFTGSFVEGLNLPLSNSSIVNGAKVTDNFQISFVNPNPAVAKQYTLFFGVTNGATTFLSNSDAVFTVSSLLDAIAPVVTPNGTNPVDLIVGDNYVDAGATAVDNIDPVVNVVTAGSVNTAIEGTYTITYTATDTSGNVGTATRTVNVGPAPMVDTTAPIITLLGTVPDQVTVGASYVDPGATAYDDFDGDVTSKIVAVSTVNTAIVGSYTITYTVSDLAGNTASEVRTVDVVAAPVVYKVGDINHDGLINGMDYTILLLNWGKTSGPADINLDGIVNGMDYTILLLNWGK